MVKTCQATGRFHFSKTVIKFMPNKLSAIVYALMALSYSVMGILIMLYPESAFSERFLPNYRWSYYLGILLVVYGVYRAWRAYKKFEDDNDNDDEEYEYYDGRKG
jgi:hypothetical protein